MFPRNRKKKEHIMKKLEIPLVITSAAASMLAPYCEGLTPSKLEAALTGDAERDITERLTELPAAAKALKVSLPTIRRMIADRELEPVRVRRRVFVRTAELRAIIDGRSAE